MRKMTKTVVTLAAMSAMTAAAASMAFAATNSVDGLNAVKTATEAKAAGANSGTWGGDDKEGWTFTTEDGIKLKNTWAEIDGVWYYFHKDGKMAQDEIVYLDGESYFFADTGAMATGWQQIKSTMDAYGDVEIDETLWKETNVSSQEDWAYDYNDYVWCYFFENGAAAENEWFQDNTGLWYYFDELVMVMNTMNYVIDPDNYDKDDSSSSKIYGFDVDGAMLVGWNYVKNGSNWNNSPTADEEGRTWFYYASNGAMQKKGWKKIDGNWYLFAEAGSNWLDNTKKDAGGVEDSYPLIVNSYVTSYPTNKAVSPEFFYLDDDGKMQTGVVTLPKKVNIVDFYLSGGGIDSNYHTDENSGKPEIYFGSDGAADEKLVSGHFYTLAEYGNALTMAVDFDNEVTKLSNTSLDVTAAMSNAVTSYDVNGYYGRVIKEAFIGDDGDVLYLTDKDGDLVTYKAVKVVENYVINSDGDKADAYVLFDRYGEAYNGYAVKDKSVTIGGKTYWSTGTQYDITIAGVSVSVFTINKQ